MARDYEPIPEIGGNPNRKTKQQKEPRGSPAAAQRRRRDAPGRGQAQQKRVQVTPADWDALKRVASDLGLPYSQVYNVAFAALLRERKER